MRRSRIRRSGIAAFVVTLVASVASVESAEAAVLMVTVLTDVAPSSCDAHCSLREAIIAANDETGHPGPDTIVLPANAVFDLGIANYGDDTGVGGDLDVTSQITIEGSSSVVDQKTNERVFHVLSSGDLTLRDLTVTGGEPNPGSGAGIYNAGVLTLEGSAITDNYAVGLHGGGIFNDFGATLGLDATRVSNNRAGLAGGGIFGAGAEMTITESVIASNSAGSDGGGIRNGNVGGLEITNSVIRSNSATVGAGGGLSQGTGQAVVNGSRLQGNNAVEGGGLVVNAAGGDVDVVASTVSANSATSGGGATNLDGGLSFVASTISGNSTSLGSVGGGGILSAGGVTRITNSTISANRTGGAGGGVLEQSNVTTISHSTITGNVADMDNGGDDGGGVAVAGAGSMTLTASIVAQNVDVSSDHDDCAGTITSENHNVVGDAQPCSILQESNDAFGTTAAPIDPAIGPLSINGGGTETHALTAASPARDRVPLGAYCGTQPETDQRGVPRPFGSTCDSGSYELAMCATTTVNIVGTSGDDDLVGTHEDDGVLALGGADTIDALGGDDAICAGGGNDLVRGGPGSDTVFGEAGRDRLFGDEDADRLDGGPSKDDRCVGGPAADTFRRCEKAKQ